MSFNVIVAADRDRGISKDGELPWHLPGDLAHFVAVTRGDASAPPGERANAVIMGRKTWDSIPARFRPLSGRLNIVVTSNPGLDVPAGALVASGLPQALDLASARARDVFVVGGGEIYEQALNRPDCGRIYYTRVDGSFGCDTFFPPLEPRFEREQVLREAEENGVAYRIEMWTPSGSETA